LRGLSWRIVRDPPCTPAWNMAVDEALARTLRPGEGVLRIYRWRQPTLSFGRNQAVRDRYDPEALGPLGIGVVRRPTGGREVLHDRELTYAVVLPVDELGSVRTLYRLVNEGLLEGLRSLDVAAALSPSGGRTPPLESGACFLEPAGGEVEVDGRKIVGSAQRRFGSALLQHGSLLLGPPSVALSALLTPAAAVASPVEQGGVGLAQVLGGPVSFGRVAAAVEAGLAGVLGGSWARGEMRPEEDREARELLSRYEGKRWTWSR
jgi:lipoyl(octanoyl) transferase